MGSKNVLIIVPPIHVAHRIEKIKKRLRKKKKKKNKRLFKQKKKNAHNKP